jgi:hypothetical protein
MIKKCPELHCVEAQSTRTAALGAIDAVMATLTTKGGPGICR